MGDPHYVRKGQLIPLRDHAALELECASGALWVTQAGRPEDHVLAAGETLSLPANRHTVAKALSDSQVWVRGARCVTQPEACGA